jgi:hypothetical protein
MTSQAEALQVEEQPWLRPTKDSVPLTRSESNGENRATAQLQGEAGSEGKVAPDPSFDGSSLDLPSRWELGFGRCPVGRGHPWVGADGIPLQGERKPLSPPLAHPLAPSAAGAVPAPTGSGHWCRCRFSGRKSWHRQPGIPDSPATLGHRAAANPPSTRIKSTSAGMSSATSPNRIWALPREMLRSNWLTAPASPATGCCFIGGSDACAARALFAWSSPLAPQGRGIRQIEGRNLDLDIPGRNRPNLRARWSFCRGRSRAPRFLCAAKRPPAILGDQIFFEESHRHHLARATHHPLRARGSGGGVSR